MFLFKILLYLWELEFEYTGIIELNLMGIMAQLVLGLSDYFLLDKNFTSNLGPLTASG